MKAPQNTTLEKTLHELAKFNFVLSEGRKGNHLLFDQDSIRKTFLRDQDVLRTLFQERLDEINQALNESFSFSSFEEKREYLSSLPSEIQHALIFGYFQLLDAAPENESPAVH